MKVILLGTAAGGGFPQWNCACALCARCHRGELTARSQESVAVSGNGRDWWLLNASPDIRTQLLATPALRPGPGPRDTPVRGVLLTDAELDHTLGLTILRGGTDLTVHAAPPVRDALTADLPLHGLLDRYAPWHWHDSTAPDGFALEGGLTVTAHPVSSKAPKFVGRPAPGAPWVVAYRIEDVATGGALVYAPCLASWPDAFDDLLASASCALLDGTFFGADELGRAVRREDTGQALMGHLPVSGPRGSLAALTRHPGLRRIYTHLNNTNPLLDPFSSAGEAVRHAGAEVLPDGSEIIL